MCFLCWEVAPSAHLTMASRATSGVVDLRRLVRAVRDSATLEAALEALARALGPRFPVIRVSLRLLDPEGFMELVGVWAGEPTRLPAGTRMHVRATSFPEVLREGRAIVSEDIGEISGLALPLLDQLLLALAEGVQSWVAVPVRRAWALVGLLNFSSDRPGAFRQRDVPFFTDLGEAVQGALLDLAGGPRGRLG